MKKRMIAIALLILAGIALFVFVSPLKSHKAVSQQDLRDADFLDDKEALLYFSSSADQDAFGGGKSYALFISQNGSLSSFKMKGLELGSAKVHGDSVMLEDKNTIYTIKDGLSSHKEPISTPETARAFCKIRTVLHPLQLRLRQKETGTVQSYTARSTESGKRRHPLLHPRLRFS